jgi:hypothetical protein
MASKQTNLFAGRKSQGQILQKTRRVYAGSALCMQTLVQIGVSMAKCVEE